MVIKRILKNWHRPHVAQTAKSARCSCASTQGIKFGQVWQPALLSIAAFALFAQTLFAGPFDRRRQVALDELCLDGDLNLSLPLARVKLDEKTTLEIRVEHEMRTGDYGNVRSELIVRPLFTNVVPYDRQDLIWNKPNGDKVVLVSQNQSTTAIKPENRDGFGGPTARPYNSPGQRPGNQDNNNPSPEGAVQSSRSLVNTNNWPEAARAFLGEGISWRFASSKAIAYSDKQCSKVIIFSEQYWFGYKDGSLSWFILPSGKLVNVQSKGSFIRGLTIDGEELISSDFSTDTTDAMRIRTKSTALNFEFDPAHRPSAIKNAANAVRLKFEYEQTGLLSAVVSEKTTSLYAWQSNPQGMPRFMDWMKPYRLRSVNGKDFGYTYDYDYIKLQVAAPRSELLVKFRYGQIVSMKKR